MHLFYVNMLWINRNLLFMLCKGGWRYSSAFLTEALVPCLPVIHSGILKMSRWLPDYAPGTGRGWRAQNTSHWCSMNMPLLPRGTCVISTVFVCGALKCIPSRRLMWDNIYIRDPILPCVCLLSPQPLYSPEGFMQLHHFACSYCTPSPPVVKTKQTLETTLKTSWENKLPLKVIFPLTPDTAQCFTSENSCAATVIRIGSCWMCYSRSNVLVFLSDMSLLACVCVHISWARGGEAGGWARGRRGGGLDSELLRHLQ